MTRPSKKLLVTFSIILLLSLGVYLPTFKSFFQQDEWFTFGTAFIAQKTPFLQLLSSIFALKTGHYTPFRDLVFYGIFPFFKTNYFPWIFFSLIAHLLVTSLVFLLSFKLTKNNVLAMMAALLFSLSAAGSQATTWVVTDINTHGAIIFSLISILLFLKFVDKPKKSYLFFSLGMLLSSLLFKEIAIAQFLLFICLLFVLKVKNKKTNILIISSVAVFYILLRAVAFLLPHPPISDHQVVTDSQPVNYLVYNLITFPEKTLVQTFIPPHALLDISSYISSKLPSKITGEAGTTNFDHFKENTVSQVLITFLFFLFSFLIFLTYKKTKISRLKEVLLFSYLFILINGFVYALSPGRSGTIIFIDSRNLYFPLIGSCILLPVILSTLFNTKKLPQVIFLTTFFIFNLFYLEKDLSQLSNIGTLRKNILTTIKETYPNLSTKTIFFTESDMSYYGLPENERVFPFQSGFGHTLLIWYSSTHTFPNQFIDGSFLWDLESQGYKEINGKGFGYYRDFTKLLDTLRENNISKDSVLAWNFNSLNNNLEDITSEVRHRIDGAIAPKKLISPSLYSLSSLQNPKDISFMSDRNKKTLWDSHLPYNNSQNIEIKLKGQFKVAQIAIDSTGNQDQNMVGYQVMLSDNGKDWKQVFHSNIYPPSENNTVNLYFEPQRASYVRIEQIGRHKFASWAVNELYLYETNN